MENAAQQTKSSGSSYYGGDGGGVNVACEAGGKNGGAIAVDGRLTSSDCRLLRLPIVTRRRGFHNGWFSRLRTEMPSGARSSVKQTNEDKT